MIEFLINNWSEIGLLIGGIAAWYGGRKHLLNSQIKHSQASVIGANIDNVTATLEIYQGVLDDLKIRFKSKIADLEEDLDKIKILNEELRKVVSGNERYIKKLQNKLLSYEKLEK